jgi:hypothetical protein
MKRNPNQLIEDVINKMFELAGHSLKYEDVVGRKDNWFQEYTMTQEQNEEWRNWGTTYLRKKKRWPKHIAEREMAFIDLYCGLKIEKTENGKEQNSN